MSDHIKGQYIPLVLRRWWEPGYRGPAPDVDSFAEPPDDFIPVYKWEKDEPTGRILITASQHGSEIACMGTHTKPTPLEKERLRKALWAALQEQSGTHA